MNIGRFAEHIDAAFDFELRRLRKLYFCREQIRRDDRVQRVPSGQNAAPCTQALCPERVANVAPVLAFQRRAVASQEAVTM